jgi:tRNA A-37 threonylcarbamoyl transferase component Bud32
MTEKDKPTIPIHVLDKSTTKPIFPDDPMVGYRIAGRYEILRPLARGGFGQVFKARDTKLERIVAIKLVDLGKASEDTRSRMLREARANARLHHPNVVVLHDAGEDPYGLYLVLEYVAGASLADVLQGGPLEPQRAAEIAEECALALGAAHAHGIVHRDVKPANILLTESGRVKVADFGVARMVGEARLTDRGSIIGTPNYMAPEQIDGVEVGPEADMFALGCVLYEMLAGRPPFDGDTTSEVLGRILRGSPDPMPPLDHSVAPLVDIVTALLDKNPHRRLRPNEFLQRIRSWERQEGLRFGRLGRVGRGRKIALIAGTAIVAALIGANLARRDRVVELPPREPSVLVRVADPPASSGDVVEETIRFSSRDALFAYVEFVGRGRSGLRKVDEKSLLLEGPSDFVKSRVEEARVIDQLLGYDFFREPNLLTSGRASSRLVTCDFVAIQPSELIALFSAAAGWPVVQSADVPLASSEFLRVSAENQPWDDLVLKVLRAAGLGTHRYETIWLVTAEDVPIVPRGKTLTIFPRRHSTEDVRQRAEAVISDAGLVWTVEAKGSTGVVVVDGADGIDRVLESIASIRGTDWDVVNPRSFTGRPVSLRLEDAPLKDMLDFYSTLSRRPHVAVAGTSAWVRASVVEIPADECLTAVLDANGLAATDSGARVEVRPIATEVVEVRLKNTEPKTLEPLRRRAEQAAARTGVPATISARADVVRIEARSDVARDLASIVEAIDSALGR